MADADLTDFEKINVFEVDETYLFKHYFEADDIFKRLKQYYNGHQYRFEIPPADFESLQEFLSAHRYNLSIVASTTTYVVAVKQYSTHPDRIFKESVIQRTEGEYNCFLMRTEDAAQSAIAENGTSVSAVDITNPFE